MIPSWTNIDFEEAATKIAKSFIAGEEHGGTPLNDLAEKVARDNSLNPEQIKRLCRKANTRTFELKYASMDGDERNPDFNLADADQVISKLHKIHEINVKQANFTYVDLNNEYKIKYKTIEKTASVTEDVDSKKQLRIKLASINQYLEDSTYESVVKADDWLLKLGELQNMFNRIDFDIDDFEKNAVAIFGSDCFVEINKLRELRNSIVFDKTASVHFDILKKELIGIEDEYTNKLAEAINCRKTYDKCLNDINKVLKIKVATERALQ